ncbi:MAG TPA: hypothetical protein VN200_04220 [Rhodoglobus sp.]|nr:hypothetical protein [Rhodoglobus sp.]
MSKAIAWMAGLFLVGHGLIGLMIEGNHFLLFSTDFALDVLWLASGGALFFASRATAGEFFVRLVLGGVGAVFILLGVLGLFDRYLFGAAPIGLGEGDHLIFFGGGAATLLGAILPHAGRPIWETPTAAPDGTVNR